jgi:hypothetical protein
VHDQEEKRRFEAMFASEEVTEAEAEVAAAVPTK